MYSRILNPIRLQELARNWLREDTSSFNFSGVFDKDNCTFDIFMKTPGVLAGIPFAEAVFTELGVTPSWSKADGDVISSVTKIGNVHGSAKNLLLAEHIVVNVLSRASGIATITHKMLAVLKTESWKGILASTQNTTPGFKMVENYALLVGGADIHRYDLSNSILLKENHFSLAGSIYKAVEKARTVKGFSLKIEARCSSFRYSLDAARTNCDVIMLDSFTSEEPSNTAYILKAQSPGTLVEASGDITEQNIVEFANPWVDIISSPNLLQGYPIIKFSMRVDGLTPSTEQLQSNF